jgi:gamma-glutamyltranspeptidase/glutathione hydrolase
MQLAWDGVVVDEQLATAVSEQRNRLCAGGAQSWDLLASPAGALWHQPRLGALLKDVASRGADAFYAGAAADAVVAAVGRCGGSLSLEDLAGHETPCPSPVSVPWQDGRAHVQPPMSQGVLLAMALQAVGDFTAAGVPVDDHVLVEVTEAAFAHRASCERGSALLAEKLSVDLRQAGGKGGPRAYLHTAGVAVADAEGLVVSSLVSVFDDFGSGVFVPELGLVLNNRAAGFTDGDNSPGPGKRPVHTLAPAMVTTERGALAIATPGADGQVQTLLQVLTATALQGRTLAEAVSRPRWRSQDGDLLVEPDHPSYDELASRGHRLVERGAGADVFGAVVAAGVEVGTGAGVSTSPFAVADWRRQTSCGGAA